MSKACSLILQLPLVCSPIFAESWSGALVDSTCYGIEERNTTLKAEEVNHDRDFEINQCKPSGKTKSYAIVRRDGQMLHLDSSANAKAADLVRNYPSGDGFMSLLPAPGLRPRYTQIPWWPSSRNVAAL
jgi:hypothetical protein